MGFHEASVYPPKTFPFFDWILSLETKKKPKKRDARIKGIIKLDEESQVRALFRDVAWRVGLGGVAA